jgi:hypothetical protein
MRAGRTFTALTAAAALGAPAAAGAAPSDLDTSFGKGGLSYQPKVLAGLGEFQTAFISLRSLPDGRIVALAHERCGNGCYVQSVARYTTSGKPDRTYGTPGIEGIAEAPGKAMFPGEAVESDDASTSATGLAVADDGGVVLGYNDRPAGPSLVRRGPRGGVVSTLPLSERVTPLAVLPDGRVLVVRDGRAVLLRSDGTADPSVGGEEGVPVSATGAVLGTVAGGAAVVAGTDPDGIALARIPLDGSPVIRGHIPLRRPSDSPFISFAPIDLGVDANGGVKVLVRTYRQSGFDDAPRRVIGAFTELGQADGRFGGGDGILGIAAGDPRMAVQRNGKIVIVASYARKAGDSTRSLIGVRRLNAGGRADRTFKARRLRSVAKEIIGLDVALDRRGRIVIGAGGFTTYGSSGVLLVRLRGGEAPRPKPAGS